MYGDHTTRVDYRVHLLALARCRSALSYSSVDNVGAGLKSGAVYGVRSE